MAESEQYVNTGISKTSVPSNEKLIESLTSDLEKCLVKDETDQLNISDKVLENKENSEDNDSVDLSGSNLNSNREGLSPEEENDASPPTPDDDIIDELAMKDRELTYSEEDRVRLRKEAEDIKNSGNELFKAGQYRESALQYTQALRLCPLAFEKDRAILYSNRAATKMKLGLNESAIEDCSKSVELDERYLKALYRRAQLYETTDKLDEALADYNKILELDPLHRDALHASKRLPDQIQERNEKLKTEMLGKLKDLGNMFLKPFGLSTDSFQINQDSNSGGYSVNFKS